MINLTKTHPCKNAGKRKAYKLALGQYRDNGFMVVVRRGFTIPFLVLCIGTEFIALINGDWSAINEGAGAHKLSTI